MFDLKSIRKSEAIAAPRVMLYGVEGIGKTTFAAGAPNPIFILTEDGLGSLKVDHFPLARSSSDVMEAIGTLYSEKHDFKTQRTDKTVLRQMTNAYSENGNLDRTMLLQKLEWPTNGLSIMA